MTMENYLEIRFQSCDYFKKLLEVVEVYSKVATFHVSKNEIKLEETSSGGINMIQMTIPFLDSCDEKKTDIDVYVNRQEEEEGKDENLFSFSFLVSDLLKSIKNKGHASIVLTFISKHAKKMKAHVELKKRTEIYEVALIETDNERLDVPDDLPFQYRVKIENGKAFQQQIKVLKSLYDGGYIQLEEKHLCIGLSANSTSIMGCVKLPFSEQKIEMKQEKETEKQKEEKGKKRKLMKSYMAEQGKKKKMKIQKIKKEKETKKKEKEKGKGKDEKDKKKQEDDEVEEKELELDSSSNLRKEEEEEEVEEEDLNVDTSLEKKDIITGIEIREKIGKVFFSFKSLMEMLIATNLKESFYLDVSENSPLRLTWILENNTILNCFIAPRTQDS